jgi:hypothetical protein
VIFFPLNFGHELKSDLAGSATFDASNFEQSDGCDRPILAVLSIFSMNISRGMPDSEPDHFGSNEMIDINKCFFRLVSSAFDCRSAGRLDFCMVS